jgi:hypothetical protein
MTTADQYVSILIDEGYTEREARFLNLVAEHSGFFTVAQYRRFLNLKAGKTSQRLIDRVQEYGHATVAGRINQKSEVLRLTKGLCDTLDTQYPRPKEASVRLQALDYVIDNPDLDYLAREKDKVTHFIGLGISKDKYSRINEHFFDERMPIFKYGNGAGFVWVDNGSLDAFEAFLCRYAALLNSLKKGLVVFATTNGNAEWGAKRFESTMVRLENQYGEWIDLERRPASSLGGPELRRLRALRESVFGFAASPFRSFERFVLKHRYRISS